MKILYIFILLLLPIKASSDENYQIYTGNGVRTNFSGMVANFAATRRLIGDDFDGKSIGWNIAVNTSTLGGLGDAYESIEQFIRDQTNTEFTWKYIVKHKLLGALVSNYWQNFPSNTNERTLNDHVSRYKNAIESGDSVLVIPHSQGNWYALEARDRVVDELECIDDIEKRITAFHVASPASRVTENKPEIVAAKDLDYYLTNDKDGIQLVPGHLPANAAIEFKDGFNSATPWWNSNWVKTLGWIPVVGPQLEGTADAIARYFAHGYVETYSNPSLKISDQLKDGIFASLRRLEFSDTVYRPKTPIVSAGTFTSTYDYVDPEGNRIRGSCEVPGSVSFGDFELTLEEDSAFISSGFDRAYGPVEGCFGNWIDPNMSHDLVLSRDGNSLSGNYGGEFDSWMWELTISDDSAEINGFVVNQTNVQNAAGGINTGTLRIDVSLSQSCE